MIQLMAISPEVQGAILLLIAVALLWVLFFQSRQTSRALMALSARVDTVDSSLKKPNGNAIEAEVRKALEQTMKNRAPDALNRLVEERLSLQRLTADLGIEQMRRELEQLKSQPQAALDAEKIQRAVLAALQDQLQQWFDAWKESQKYELAEELMLLLTHEHVESGAILRRVKFGYLEQIIPEGKFAQAAVKTSFRRRYTHYTLLIEQPDGSRAKLFLSNVAWKSMDRLRLDPDKSIFPLFHTEDFPGDDKELMVSCKPAILIRNGERWELQEKGNLFFHTPPA